MNYALILRHFQAFLRFLPFSVYKIIGQSMMPKLTPQDKVLTFNWAYLFLPPQLRDIVVINYQDKIIIKRITKINGSQVFLEGENKSSSTDSNHFGWVDKKKLLGKIIYIF